MPYPIEHHHWYDIHYHISHAAIMMIVTTGGWFQSLSETTRTAIAVGSILGFGVGIGMTVSNIYGLPSQVDTLADVVSDNSSSITQNDDEIDALKRSDDYQIRLSEWMACVLAAHDDASINPLATCGIQPTRLFY